MNPKSQSKTAPDEPSVADGDAPVAQNANRVVAPTPIVEDDQNRAAAEGRTRCHRDRERTQRIQLYYQTAKRSRPSY
jgi:hypothetical protein